MTFAISTMDGDHLGFIVLTGGPESGACVIKSLPGDAQCGKLPESSYLLALQKTGELTWQRSADEVHISDLDGEIVLHEKQGRMTGSKFVYFVEEVIG